MDLPLLTEKTASKFWTTTMWAVYDGDVPIMRVENDCVMENSVLLVYDVGPLQCPEMEAQSWFPQQRITVGDTDGELGW